MLLRPKEYIKNSFVLLPAFFGAKMGVLTEDLRLAGAFVGFCLLSSAVYILNDICDKERDARHPIKKNRPIAAGSISVPWAAGISVALALLAGVCAWLVDGRILLIFGIYVAVNILYSAGGKHIALFDLCIIASGFLLRTCAGGIAGEVPISKWLYLMVFLMAIGLGLSKRLEELMLLEKHGIDPVLTRPSLKGYSPAFIKTGFIVVLTVAIVCYIIYSVSPETESRLGSPYTFTTSFPVILGVLRYMQLVFSGDDKFAPLRVIWRDLPMQLIVLSWLVMFSYFIYF